MALSHPLAYPQAAMAMSAMREKMENLRDTLVVLAVQISFRVVMWMRQLNY